MGDVKGATKTSDCSSYGCVTQKVTARVLAVGSLKCVAAFIVDQVRSGKPVPNSPSFVNSNFEPSHADLCQDPHGQDDHFGC